MAEEKKVLTTENLAAIKELNDAWYQEKLESGVNIKTINGISILGNGDIVIKASDGGDASVELLATAWRKNNWYDCNTLVTYNKKIYRCVNSNSDSSFNTRNWEQTTIADGILDIMYNQNYVNWSDAYNAANSCLNDNFASKFDTRLNSQFNDKFDARFDAKMDELLNTEM